MCVQCVLFILSTAQTLNVFGQASMAREESTLAIVLKVLEDIVWQFDKEHLDYLFTCLRKVPVDQYVPATVDMFKELSRFTYKVLSTHQIDYVFFFFL
jgi:hypothetical protein